MIPRQAIVTGCVQGCPARIAWSYDPGERQTYWEPGCPEWFEPTVGGGHQPATPSEWMRDPSLLEVDHTYDLTADASYGGYADDLYRQLWQWEALWEAALRLAGWSRAYLNGRQAAFRAASLNGGRTRATSTAARRGRSSTACSRRTSTGSCGGGRVGTRSTAGAR